MTAAADAEAPPKKSKMPLILGVILALVGGGLGYFAVSSGLIGGRGGDHADASAADLGTEAGSEAEAENAVPVAFVPLEPMVISLQGPQKYLRFTAQVEVAPAAQAEVTRLIPRIVDVLNGYLRAVDSAELADPAALMRLRAQMLRRVQVVAGADNVRDLLIMEFVLN